MLKNGNPGIRASLLLLFDIQMWCSFKGFYLLIALPGRARARYIFHVWIEAAFSSRARGQIMLIALRVHEHKAD